MTDITIRHLKSFCTLRAPGPKMKELLVDITEVGWRKIGATSHHLSPSYRTTWVTIYC